MLPGDLAFLVRVALYVWLALLAANIAYGLLSGRINTHRILSHDDAPDTSADRVVLLLTTLGFALYYFITALKTPLDPIDPRLPDISADMLVALLGANGFYLTTKFMHAQTGRS